MKKLLLLSLVSVLFLGTLSAQSSTQRDLSHWSLDVKAGLDYYRIGGTSNPDTDLSVFETYVLNGGWVLPKISLEYTLNPYVGFGIDAGYFTYNRDKLKGSTTDLILFASINAANLLYPERTGFWERVNVYTNFGPGVGFYRYELQQPDITGASASPLFVGAVNIELRLNNSWALGGEASYRFYLREDLAGVNTPNLDNDAFAVTVGLRYKFGANSKQHIRNMNVNDYYPIISQDDVDKSIQKALAALPKGTTAVSDYPANQRRIEDLEDENAIAKNKLRQLENDLKNLNDKEAGASISASFENIEFEFGSSRLTAGSYKILDNVAEILNTNPSWTKIKIILSGHADNTGSTDFNQKLSEERANAVKDYLVSKRVTPSNIVVIGYGKDKPLESNETSEGRQANRRVEFEISK